MTAFIWTIVAIFVLSILANVYLLGDEQRPFTVKELDKQRIWRIGFRIVFILWALYLLNTAA